jgi:hypothetical protein
MAQTQPSPDCAPVKSGVALSRNGRVQHQATGIKIALIQ